MSEEAMEWSPENSVVSGFKEESSEHSPSEKWLKTSKITPFIQLDIQSELIEQNNSDHLGYGHSHHTPEAGEKHQALKSHAVTNTEKTYTVTRRKEKLSSILLPLSAASYYSGVSPQMEIVESCQTIEKLNEYLKARKDDVNAGVPGKFLRAVMGSDGVDVGTVASIITYSFYLDVTSESDQYCTVPIININRTNLGSHVELKWLLDSCHIDQSSLIFADEIDLCYYDLFGSLKIVLLKGSKIKQEKLKHAVVENFHSRKGETIYPWVKTVITGEECSSCTAIADKFVNYSPEILASKSFSKLLLAGILLDTANLRDPACTSKDKYTASLLINGAGRYGCNGFYQLLKYKMHDLSSLQVADILWKDFKKWTGQESGDSRSLQIGMSCIGISIGQLLSRAENLAQEITRFQLYEKLRALIVVSGYFTDEKNFKREVLICTESTKLLESLLFFFDFNASRLPLKAMHFPGLKNEMKAYEIDKVTSRKIVEHLIQEFVGIPKP
ncbi:exopolyphosphatase [Vigna unguiculata]|uniref:Exopolyphosphatase n=1 Tax=Vigna unguiculata TaxID=3917 RepID=A0A4D6LLV7_VIGUN|nr:exopolyphosphatase [Vigna unguiculata]